MGVRLDLVKLYCPVWQLFSSGQQGLFSTCGTAAWPWDAPGASTPPSQAHHKAAEGVNKAANRGSRVFLHNKYDAGRAHDFNLAVTHDTNPLRLPSTEDDEYDADRAHNLNLLAAMCTEVGARWLLHCDDRRT